MKRSPLNPGDKPLQRKTPLRSGHSREGKAKPTKRARYTGPTPAMRKAVLERDEFHCTRCGRDLLNSGLPYSLQHRLPRGRGGTNTLANLVSLCGDATTPDCCHSEVESYRRRATAEGWLVPTGTAPEEWPVLRHSGWALPGESWSECEPHPMQLDMGTAA